MEYTLIDISGSTLDVFEELPAAREAVASVLSEDAEAADELLVLVFAEGKQLGPPIAATDFVAPTKSYFAQLIASYLIDWTPQIEFAPLESVDPEASIEIKWEAEEPDPDADLTPHGPRLVLC